MSKNNNINNNFVSPDFIEDVNNKNNNKPHENPQKHPQQLRYTEVNTTNTGHIYTRHIKNEDDVIIKLKNNNKLAATSLDKLYVDPYKVNEMMAYDVSIDEINSFDDKINKGLLQNEKFMKSSYSSIAPINYNPNVDLWNQSSYRDDKYQRLFLNKMGSQKTETKIDVKNNNDQQSITSSMFSSMTFQMETLLMQHNFVRETLLYFLPKLQYSKIQDRKSMNIGQFISLYKRAGLHLDSKKIVRSGIYISNVIEIINNIKTETLQIQLTFRYCEMQTEYIEPSSSDKDTKNPKNKIKDSSFREENILNDINEINKMNKQSNNYIELHKMTLREMDNFMEDNLRCNIVLIALSNIDSLKKFITSKQTQLTINDIEKTNTLVKIKHFQFNVV